MADIRKLKDKASRLMSDNKYKDALKLAAKNRKMKLPKDFEADLDEFNRAYSKFAAKKT